MKLFFHDIAYLAYQRVNMFVKYDVDTENTFNVFDDNARMVITGLPVHNI